MYSSSYKLMFGQDQLGEIINIPKDQFLKSAKYIPDSKTLQFTFDIFGDNGIKETTTNINVNDFVHEYIGGKGILVDYNNSNTNNETPISIKLNESEDNKFINLTADGLGLSGITDAFTDADSILSTNIDTISSDFNTISSNFNTISSDFNTISSNFNIISSDFNTISSDFNTISSDFNTISSDFNTISSDFNTISSDFNTISADFNTISSDINTISSDFNILSSDINTISSDFNILSSDINTISSDFNTISSDFNTISSDFNTISSDFNILSTNIDTISSDFNTISSDFNTISSNFNTISSDFNTISSDFNTISSDFNTISSDFNILSTNINNLSTYVDEQKFLKEILVSGTDGLTVTEKNDNKQTIGLNISEKSDNALTLKSDNGLYVPKLSVGTNNALGGIKSGKDIEISEDGFVTVLSSKCVKHSLTIGDETFNGEADIKINTAKNVTEASLNDLATIEAVSSYINKQTNFDNNISDNYLPTTLAVSAFVDDKITTVITTSKGESVPYNKILITEISDSSAKAEFIESSTKTSVSLSKEYTDSINDETDNHLVTVKAVKDYYESQIEGLQGQIDALSGTIKKLQEYVESKLIS